MQELSQEQERALLASAQEGDGEAMGQIVMQYVPLVMAAGHQRYVRSIAEDAVGAAAEELVRAVHAYDVTRGVPFAAFVKVRVYGAVSHLFRKTCRVWEHEGAACTPDVLECAAEDAPLDASDARLMISPLLACLSEEERRVLSLLYQRCVTTYEAADLLGCSQSKVMQVKRRALERLREGLAGER